jgi:hypothetical protein
MQVELNEQRCKNWASEGPIRRSPVTDAVLHDTRDTCTNSNWGKEMGITSKLVVTKLDRKTVYMGNVHSIRWHVNEK